MMTLTAGQLWQLAGSLAVGLLGIWLLIEKGLGWLARRFPVRPRPAPSRAVSRMPGSGPPLTGMPPTRSQSLPPPVPPTVIHSCGCAVRPCPPHAAARGRHPVARPRADFARWENEIGSDRP